MKLAGKVALVTGAARRLGKAIALELARQGAGVAVHYGHSADAAEATAGEIEALGVPAWTARADLTDPAAVDRLFDDLEERLDRLDVLINSAASFEQQPLVEITVEAWDRVMALNLRAPFLMMRRAAPWMRRSPRGEGDKALVVNMADLSGIQAWPGFAHHGVSKAGLIHLSRVAARELAPEVRVNAIVPGAILPPPGVEVDSEQWRSTAGELPLRCTGDPSQVARTVVYLAETDFVTGAVLPVDGGEHLLGARER